MNDWAKRIIELAKESNSVRFVFEPSDGEVYRQTNLEPSVVSALCERLLKLERAVKPLQDLTNAALAGIKPLPSQVQSAFDVLEELEKDAKK